MEKVIQWMVEETRRFYQKNYVLPDKRDLPEITEHIYERSEKNGIALPYGEISRLYRQNRSHINEIVISEVKLHEDRRTETVSFTNMCMIQDAQGRVVALNKKSGGYTGITFPGGHLEEGETFFNAVIREVFEETGLKINNPLLCGIYHWTKNDIHHVIFLYKATEFSGELKSSDEGDVYWIPIEEYRQKELAGGMKEVLEIICEGKAQECWMHLENGRYREYLY